MLNNSKTIIADSLYVYNEATESLINVNDSLNNTGSAIDQEILDRKADKTEVSQLLATKLNITTYTTKITDINTTLSSKLNISDFNSTNTTNLNLINLKVNTTDINNTLSTKLNISDFNSTNATNLNLINLKVNTTDINNTLSTKLNISDYNTTANNIITNINNTFNTKLNITDFDNFKITNNSELNARQGIFYPIEPLYFSANFDLNRMELILSEEEITTLTNFYNKDYINTLAISNNSSFSTLLNNINSRVLTTDYNLKMSDINTTLGSKLNISEISNYDTTITVNSKLINNAVAWSSGLVNDSYHYINTGSEALVVRNNMAPYDVYLNILNTTGTILAYKNFEVLGSASFKTIYSSLNDHVYINDNLVINGSLSCNSLINYDTTTTINSKLLNYETTTTINSKLENKLSLELYPSARSVNLSGVSLFNFKTYVNAMTGWVDILKFETDNAQLNAYTTNTTFINELIINDGLHIHDYMHLLPTSFLKADNINISCTELSYLDGAASNIQNQLNNKLSVEVFPAAKTINLSGNSLFTIKTFKDAMTGYVDVFTIDVIDNLGYGSNSVIIGQNLGIVGDLMVMEHAQLQSTTNIYTSSNLNQNYITSGELYNMKSSTSNIQTQINARISSATLTSTLSTYDTVSSVNTKIEGTKPWVTGRLFANGTMSNNAGAQNALTSGNINNSSAGTYVFTIPAHPNGANYNIFLTASPSGGGAFLLTSNVNSSTSFTVYIYNTSGTLTNTGFNYMSVP